MRKKGLVLFFILMVNLSLIAEEGMWIPMLLEQMNIGRMQDLGLTLTAEDIYSINHSSLKDAIVQFGGGCTAEIVSAQGLIFTNHHCGLGAIQKLSSLEHDYLTNGFWAKSREMELPCQGTTVTLLVRMEDVTGRVLEGVTGELNQLQRNQLIKQNMEKVEKEAVAGTHYEARIRSFFYGNQYYLFVNEVFKDIRLVGTPPVTIGKFGGDTDNWMWPRHTGDFSVFRIYAGKNNEPAAYSPDNIPYVPRKHLSISLKGYDPDDFTFVFGYPGTTREYLSSYGVDLTVNQENPLRIGLRQKRLDIINAAMAESRQVRIQYMAKANGIANYWKKMIGESRGIKKAGAIGVKEAREQQFMESVNGDPSAKSRYGNVLRDLKETYREFLPADLSAIYFNEAAQSVEIIRFAAGFRDLVKISRDPASTSEGLNASLTVLQRASRDFYKNWNSSIDRRVMAIMFDQMYRNMAPEYRPEVIEELAERFYGDFSNCAAGLFMKSMFADSARIFQLLEDYKPSRVKTIEKDPVFRVMKGIYNEYELRVLPVVAVFSARIDSLQRIYMAGQMEVNKGMRFYPDANGTLRVAYGKVANYKPADAVTYRHFTTLAGVMQKEDTAVYDYQVDARLKMLYDNSDYGAYADRDGTMHVAFTASNHTTGGNSGSPVLNARGELIGINFDRNWEGTLSDLYYDPLQCRNISLDIRYCLFVIDRVYGNTHLVKELTILD